MNEFLIYKIFTTAVIASLFIWWKLKAKSKVSSDSYVEPKETEDGKFAIPKPADEDMDGVNYEEVRTNPKFKDDAQAMAARLPNPDGTPTKGPR